MNSATEAHLKKKSRKRGIFPKKRYAVI
jgi:serine/threonine protein kinase